MGRFAHFSNGFQYKFALGIQPSNDIIEFGGRSDLVYINESLCDYIDETVEGEPSYRNTLKYWVECHDSNYVFFNQVPEELCNYFENARTVLWSTNDQPYILKKLNDMANDFEVEVPNWTHYTFDVDGTEHLLDDLDELMEKKLQPHSFHSYILGCIIYHQLMYEEILFVNYDL